MARRWLVLIFGFVLAAGCFQPVCHQTACVFHEPPGRPLDQSSAPAEPAPAPKVTLTSPAGKPKEPVAVVQVKLEDVDKPGAAGGQLDVPPEVPGSSAAEIKLPPFDPDNRKERDAAIQKQFPPLPEVSPDLRPLPGPSGQPMSLAELEQLALANSPQVRQAEEAVRAARGAAIQAGLQPNPSIGYEGDTMGTAGGAGYQGGYVEQTIKTAGKTTYARAAAEMDLRNAELDLIKARRDLANRVRGGWFAVLVARENDRVAQALVRFTDDVYGIELGQLRIGQVTPWETAQFRVFAVQARANLAQARNRYLSAWKQLAAVLSVPDMPLTELASRAEMPMPLFDQARVLEQVLSRHTDVLSAANSVQKARYQLLLAKVTPIPDVDLRVMLQKDYTSNTFLLAPSVMMGGTVPVWDKNQGNILAAQANLQKAIEEQQRVRNDLAGKVAEAFERYATNKALLEYQRGHILPDLVRVFRGSAQRYKADPEKYNFIDVATPQQNLGTAVVNYLSNLRDFWTAVVDLTTLLQVDDLSQLCPADAVPPVLGPIEELMQPREDKPEEPPSESVNPARPQIEFAADR